MEHLLASLSARELRRAYRPTTTPEQIEEHLAAEAQYAWQLYRDGYIRENYMRADGHGAITIVECADVAEAKRLFERSPLAQAGLLDFEYIELTPFRQIELLFVRKVCSSTKTEVLMRRRAV